MPFPWPAKKEHVSGVKIEMPDLPGMGAEDETGETGEIVTLTEQLNRLGQLLDQANGQVAAYLLRRETQATAKPAEDNGVASLADHVDNLGKKLEQLALAASTRSAAPAMSALSDESLKSGLRPLLEQFSQVHAKLDILGEMAAAGTPNRPSEDTVGPAINQLRGSIGEMKDALAGAFRQLRQRVDEGLTELAGYLRPPEPVASDEPAFGPPSGGDWERVILGPALAENPDLMFQRQQLLRGVLDGEAAACSFAGQLLVFQSAPPEKMPALLKDIGEAYYRWEPKTRPEANEMEQALVAWLQRACDDARIANTIELVHSGERFDSTRHTATDRGVEITEVYGWIVLRDNGKVYTKASVAVK